MGQVSIRAKAGVLAVVSSCLLAFGAGAANAGTARTGDSFPVNYLKMPANSTPGSNSGVMGMGYVASPASPDGRYVVFASDSDNLTAGSDKESANLFRKDLQSGDVKLINVDSGGTAATGSFYSPSISSDGNLVAFVTGASLHPDDTDDKYDLYLRDVSAGTTTLLTLPVTEDIYEAELSANGLYATFATRTALNGDDTNGSETDVYRLTISNGQFTVASAIDGSATSGNDDSQEPSISDDGKWIAFSSKATNLLAGFTDNNGSFNSDVYLRNMATNDTYLVSNRYNAPLQSGINESNEPMIAGNPDTLAEVKIAFSSYATDLADNNVIDAFSDSSVYLRDMSATPSQLVSRADGPAGANADSRAHTPSVSDDGSRVIFSSDADNLGPDADYYGVYLRDLTAQSTNMVSHNNEYAVQGEISADGNSATWGEAGGATTDSDPDLSSVFSRSLATGQAKLVSRPKGNKSVQAPAFVSYENRGQVISATGRYLAFSSYSSHLPGQDPDKLTELAYRRDLKTGEIELVSRASGVNGAPAERAWDVSISSDGSRIAFTSTSSLSPEDTNDRSDVYVRDLKTGATTLVSRADGPAGAVGDDSSYFSMISGNGKRVAFIGQSGNLGADGVNDHIFVRDLETGQTKVATRGTGEAGPLANNGSVSPKLSYDGSKLIYLSTATNLDPDDAANSQSLYLRNIDANTTTLLSREPGPTGTSLPSYVYDATISGNGSRVAFRTSDDVAVPETAPWPGGATQIVVRELSDGSNQLASVSSGGQPGDGYSDNPSFSRDGRILAFDTESTNLRDGFDNTNSSTVVIRDLDTGAVSGPPRFGLTPDSFGGTQSPSVSDSGDCVAYQSYGHSAISGILGDFESVYVFVNRGTCLNPRAIVPKLSKVRLKPKRFRVSPKPTAKASARKARRGTKISFNLNTKATVTIWIEQKVKGRKAGGKCVKVTKNKRRKACNRFVRRGKLVRKNLAAGNRKVAFSGRIGRKALKPGNYRIVLQARAGLDRSNKPARPFKIVRR